MASSFSTGCFVSRALREGGEEDRHEVVELDEDLARNNEDPVDMVKAPMPTCNALLVSSMRNALFLARCRGELLAVAKIAKGSDLLAGPGSPHGIGSFTCVRVSR